jgi:hypothetical protein
LLTEAQSLVPGNGSVGVGDAKNRNDLLSHGLTISLEPPPVRQIIGGAVVTIGYN